ncbi:MAG: hypothetical protein AB7G75_10920 [Candidatus Binatia bacterium]
MSRGFRLFGVRLGDSRGKHDSPGATDLYLKFASTPARAPVRRSQHRYTMFFDADTSEYNKCIMAITGHKTFSVFLRYNNPTEEDVKTVVLANPPKKVVG